METDPLAGREGFDDASEAVRASNLEGSLAGTILGVDGRRRKLAEMGTQHFQTLEQIMPSSKMQQSLA